VNRRERRKRPRDNEIQSEKRRKERQTNNERTEKQGEQEINK
jgi:hypothetical protein